MAFEETDDDGFICHCDGDGCNIIARVPTDDFWFAVAEIKARSWRITRNRYGDWEHFCSKCWRKRTANVAEFLNRKPRANRG
jgi:hypothetical protein